LSNWGSANISYSCSSYYYTAAGLSNTLRFEATLEIYDAGFELTLLLMLDLMLYLLTDPSPLCDFVYESSSLNLWRPTLLNLLSLSYPSTYGPWLAFCSLNLAIPPYLLLVFDLVEAPGFPLYKSLLLPA